MRDYTKYDVWQKGHLFTIFGYKEILPAMPDSEKYALSSQLKRATYSIPLNIVEGCGRNSDKDFTHFLDVALGSVHEAEYCGLLAKDLDFISHENWFSLQMKLNLNLLIRLKKYAQAVKALSYLLLALSIKT